MASASKQNKTKKNTNKEAFIWTDDEVQLFLIVTNEYKVAKSFESIDWESIQSKYQGPRSRGGGAGGLGPPNNFPAID